MPRRAGALLRQGRLGPVGAHQHPVIPLQTPDRLHPPGLDALGDEAVAAGHDGIESGRGAVAAEFDGWGPKVHQRLRSGSPANEIIKAAKRFDSGLIVLASQSTRTQAVLMGSVSHKVLNQATCPVLVHRPGPKPARRTKKKA